MPSGNDQALIHALQNIVSQQAHANSHLRDLVTTQQTTLRQLKELYSEIRQIKGKLK